jgi:membrane-associated phospholipid phosphatase
LHAHRAVWADELFQIATQLGEFPGFILALTMVAILGRFKDLFGFLSAVLATLLLVYLLKFFAFTDADRPIVFFEKLGINLNFHPDYHLNRKHSFPSGHSTAAFAFFFYAALTTKRQNLQMVALLLAISVAFSRVYLVQHFVMDTIAGSILGVGIACTSFLLWQNTGRRKPWLNNKIFKHDTRS